MPALTAHPLVALPFCLLGLPMSALVIGSVVPDGIYVVPFADQQFGHSPLGLIVFCLPAGLVFFWLWHGWLKGAKGGAAGGLAGLFAFAIWWHLRGRRIPTRS